jgi:hypothetical protein
MHENPLPRELRPFMDENGRLKQWPTRQKVQRMAADYLAARFKPGREYTEKEVNALLCDWHTFADWALLRRVMFDWGYIDRESDGSRYRLRPRSGPAARAPHEPATPPPA